MVTSHVTSDQPVNLVGTEKFLIYAVGIPFQYFKVVYNFSGIKPEVLKTVCVWLSSDLLTVVCADLTLS